MAMSFSRPDPSSPTSIADASFGVSRRGFDQGEVRDFLGMVAAELSRLRERERFLEREVQVAQASGDRGPAQLDEAAMTQMLGEEAMRVLTTARESAAEIREKAERSAAQMLSEASDEATRLREEAEIEASRRRADAAADAEAELSMAKQQGREMVNEARAYRERVLSELARRRELAREQIEQLVHGRDRLMQAFERARLVAVDVVAEMQPLGEPDEYVNLTPTTGPLPVMIANSPRPAEGRSVEPERRVEPERPADPPTESVTEDADATGDLRIVDGAATATPEVDEAVEVTQETQETQETKEPEAAPDAASVVDDESTDDAVADDAVIDAAAETTESDVVVDLFARLRADAEGAGDAGDAEGAGDAGDAGDAEASGPDAEVSEADDADPAASIAPNDAVVAAVVAATQSADDQAADAEVRPAELMTDDVVGGDAAAAAGDVAADDVVADDAVDGGNDAEPTVFERRDEAITPLIVSSARKLKRALADEQNEVLDALRRSDRVQSLDILLPWASEHGLRYTGAIEDELFEAVYAGSALSHVGGRKIRKALATDAVEAADEALVHWLVMPLRDRLERCIDEGGGDNIVVTKKVRAVYREWKTQRIDETLDDVFRSAHGRGVLAGFDPDTPVVWEIDTRFPGCPDCDDNALAGAVAAWSPFPTGDVTGPAHQGCRCILVAADR